NSATITLYTLSLHDALPIFCSPPARIAVLSERSAWQGSTLLVAPSRCSPARTAPAREELLRSRDRREWVCRLVARDDRKPTPDEDRKSTRLNSSHLVISYAV